MNSRPILSELKALVVLAAPLAIAQLGMHLMGAVDVAVVGRLGAVPLAAVGLGNGIFFTLSVMGMGAMMGLDPLVSQALGAGEQVHARRLLWQGIWLSCAVGLVLSAAVLVVPWFLEPFGIAPEVATETRRYLFVRLFSMIPLLAFTGLRSYLQSARVVWPLVVSVAVANVANLVFVWLFVFGGAAAPLVGEALAWIPPMGVAGAAVATVGCTFLQLVILAFGVKRVRVAGFERGHRRPVKADLRRSLAVGVPVGLQMGAEVGIFALAGLLAGRIGADALASHQIALTLASLSFTTAVGIGTAGGVRVGLAIGSNDTRGVRRAGLTAFVAGGGFMVLSAMAFVLIPGPIIALLTDKPDLIEAAIPLLAVAAIFQISDGLQGVGAGVLRGAGDTRFTFLANVAGHYLVGLPVVLVLSVFGDLGVEGLWYGLAAGLTAVAVSLLVRFLKVSSKPIRAISAADAERLAPEDAA
ncbi:MAG: MATE family efflux transporter [Myxococcaceae bacterium]